jgi:hypothetical protein
MMSKQDRESILEGMKALKRLCIKIEKESIGVQQITINDRQFTVTWILGFDSELLAFESNVSVIPAGTDRGVRNDEACVDLENYLQDRLDGLKDHEHWPTKLPADWLAGASEILPSLAASPAAPDAG